MKPRYLEFCGVNSFSEPAKVDFDDLLQYGLFGIFGDTGSGKSTILDAIFFALYGNVRRTKSDSELINYHSDAAWVKFTFDALWQGEKKTFYVERELKRKKNAVQTTRVYEKKGETLSVLSEGARDCNALLGEIIGISQEDFEKCIVLPQGEFAQFVKATPSDRLKLVSRLFGLEAFGEKLSKRTNEKFREYESEERDFQTRLEPYESVTAERIEELKTLKNTLEAREKEGEKAVFDLREQEKTLSELVNRREEWEKAGARLKTLKEDEPRIRLLEKELGRLDRARSAVKANGELKAAINSLSTAEKELAAALLNQQNAETALESIKDDDAEKREERILQLTMALEKAKESKELFEKRDNTNLRLNEKRGQYIDEAVKFRGFDYLAEKEEIEERLALLDKNALSDTELSSLFRGEYATFAAELETIKESYPETHERVTPLIKKYRKLSAGEKKSFSQIQERLAALEKERKAENDKLNLLERKNGEYKRHLERLENLRGEGERLKKELDEIEEKLKVYGFTNDTELKIEFEILKEQKEKKKEEKSRAEEKLSKVSAALSAARATTEERKNALSAAENRLKDALSLGEFRSAEEAEALARKFTGSSSDEVEGFNKEYAAVSERYRELDKNDYSCVSREKLRELNDNLKQAEVELTETRKRFALTESEFENAKERLKEKKEYEKQLTAAKKQKDLYERLKKLFERGKFMDFVAEEYLQNVAFNASARLLSLTDGRYFLTYEKGMGFAAGDNFNGGNTRGVYTLSGGETFLVSLSLALALSAEICQKSLRPMEFFFLDEGFGTLDDHLIDTVMDSFEKLKSEHFSIGIISHVEELKHRIEKKLFVEKATEQHGSRIYS